MLDTQNVEDYLAEVKAFAEKIGMTDQLDSQLEYLDGYAENGERGRTRCSLIKDFAPHSFSFVVEKKTAEGEYAHMMSGGLIFHGSHDKGGDGSAPTFAVCLEPTTGWSIHT